MSVRGDMKEREAARRWWDGLSNGDRWELGDALVLGDFDWTDWFDSKPSSVFLREVDRERMLWESE